MKEENIHTFCAELNGFLMARFGYKHPPANVDIHSRTISCHKKRIDLYLRWDIGQSMVTIARIYFKRTQIGHGTSLLNFLFLHAKYFGYRTIQIECANAKSSAFAAKSGFINTKYNHWFLDIPQ